MKIEAFHIELGRTKISKEEFERHKRYFRNKIIVNDFVNDPMNWIVADNGKEVDRYLYCLEGMVSTIYY